MGLDVRATGLGLPIDGNGAGSVRLRTEGERLTAGTRVASARRRTKPLREGRVGLQLNCQSSSATVTNPDLIPVDTNANL
jgi:hypothetical protein